MEREHHKVKVLTIQGIGDVLRVLCLNDRNAFDLLKGGDVGEAERFACLWSRGRKDQTLAK